MKTRNKVLLLMLSAVLLVGASVFGTLAYLSSKKEVINTFTVGKVSITMDESKIKDDGKTVDTSAARVVENKYKLIPGTEYTKDPIIHVTSDSEPCYLFVKVVNGIEHLEDQGEPKNTIAAQMEKNKWKLLDGYTNVYYYTDGTNAKTDNAGADVKVFETFKIMGTATAGQLETKADVVVTAYAVQAENLTVTGAWDVVK